MRVIYSGHLGEFAGKIGDILAKLRDSHFPGTAARTERVYAMGGIGKDLEDLVVVVPGNPR